MAAYYSEHDPRAAAWLRELIREGLIPGGDVDERSIRDVRPDDVRGYTQAHFFAGIGGWPHALRLAGWADAVPVWTGSCPCQPYSGAGKRLGDADPRNLWPDFFRLIRECRPDTVFGEQVESAIRHGWLDGVSADLEGEGYAVGSAVLGAHSVGAPHIRQRLFWVADAGSEPGERGAGRLPPTEAGVGRTRQQHGHLPDRLADGRQARRVANPGPLAPRDDDAREGDSEDHKPSDGRGEAVGEPGRYRGPVGLGDSAGEYAGSTATTDAQEAAGRRAAEPRLSGGDDLTAGVAQGDAGGSGLQERSSDGRVRRGTGRSPAGEASELRSDHGFWSAFDLIPCRDGKARRVEPGTFPLAHGVSGRVGLLRGYGNAIIPQAAAEFIEAFIEAKTEVTQPTE